MENIGYSEFLNRNYFIKPNSILIPGYTKESKLKLESTFVNTRN